MLALMAACGPPSIDQLAQSVVRVEALPCGRTGVGSGTVVGDERVLTNAHIVAGSRQDVTVRTWDDEVHPAVVVGFDPRRDLALLAVDDLAADPIRLGDPAPGSPAKILARPGGVTLEVLESEIVKLFNATGDDIYGEGDVSRRALELAADVIPGVSGAGVFGEGGELLGVVFAESRRRPGVSYAVDAREVIAFLEEVGSTAADTQHCRE